MTRVHDALLPRFDYRIDAASVSEVGKVRKANEDVVRVVADLGLFLVGDGMGGLSAGGVAAALAAETVIEVLGTPAAKKVLDRYLNDPELRRRHAVFSLLRQAFAAANAAVRIEAERREAPRGMGTTLDVVLFLRDRAFIGHVGDGRVYLARASAVIQLTHDHTLYDALAAQGAIRPSATMARAVRNPLVSAVGLAPTISVDCCFVEVVRQDRVLICTDGIHREVESEAVLAQLVRAGTVHQAATALIGYALRHGGRDNATALILEIRDRFVARGSPSEHLVRSTGPVSADIAAARSSVLLEGLPVASVLALLSAAVEVEIAPGEPVPRVVASDCVAYIIVAGQVQLPSGSVLGQSGVLFLEALVGVMREGPAPVVRETARLMRLRADDFAEASGGDPVLASALYKRIAQHLARSSY